MAAGGSEMESMDFEGDEFTLTCCENGEASAEDILFDTIIGHIEDIIMENGFQRLQQEFLDQHYLEFENSEENKLSYTEIHKQYVNLIERHLEVQLRQKMPEFNMSSFTQQLISRRSDLDGEVFDILLTFSDFMLFKEMMLDHRADREGGSIDLSLGFTVTPLDMTSPRLMGLPPQTTDRGDQP